VTVEVWRGPGSRWCWRYVGPSEDGPPVELLGNRTYPTRDEALHAATTAYPGAPVRVADPGRPWQPSRPRARRWLLAAAVLAVLAAVRRRRARSR